MGYENVEVSIDGNVGTVWLSRPEKLNAMSSDMWVDIPDAVDTLNGNDNVRAIIVAARGRAFTVGIDVAMLSEMAPQGPSQAATSRDLYRTIRKMQHTASVFAASPKPVIAAVHGYCLGAGMDLITACDIRLASSDATFSVRETRMGLVADIGSLQRLPRIVGAGHAAELALTGTDITATRAAEIGLVNHLHPDISALRTAAIELAGQIADNSPLVVSGVKNVLAANDGRTVQESLDYVAQWNAAYLLSNDLFEATNAFMESRTPEFRGN